MNCLGSSTSTNSSTRSAMAPGPSAKSSVSRLQQSSRPMSPASTAGLSEFAASRPLYSAPKERVDPPDLCDFDPDGQEDPEEDFVFLEASDELPTKAQLDAARELQVYDAEGNSRPFKSLYVGEEHMGQRQLVIFVRHFYCSACQAYLKALTSTFTPYAYFSLPIPTQITVIGCGSPNLIPRYITRTNCPFRIYADPSRKLYKALGMSMTIKVGQVPEYTNGKSVPNLMVSSFTQMGRSPRQEIFKGGNMIQVGGEFLFEESRPIWCHRMRNVRDHSEMKVLKQVLEMSDAGDGDAAEDTDADELREQERQRAPSQVTSTPNGKSQLSLTLRKKISRQRTKSDPHVLDPPALTALPLSARASVSMVRREAHSSSHASNRSSVTPLVKPPTSSSGAVGKGLKVIWDGKGQAHLGRESRMGIV